MAVDLRSDTVTKPTDGMREAMMRAELGDDVLGDDPTVQSLEALCAELSGKEASVFVPSGTMANLIAIAVHTSPGDEVLMHEGAHPFNYETGGAAAIAGVQIRTLPGARGVMSPDDVRAAIRPDDIHAPRSSLLCVEDTHNRGGGAVQPLQSTDLLCAVAREHGLATHLDGARIWNAVVRSGIPLSRRARDFDTVSFCFSKGLGCPAGSVLCGTDAQIARARRWRKRLGGAMRQSGLLAGAAIYALEHHIVRLAEDHARASAVAEGLRALGYVAAPPETNIVVVEADGAAALVDRIAERGVRAFAIAKDRIRLVFHLHVTDADTQTVLSAFEGARP